MTEQKWRELRVMMWHVQIKLMFLLLFRMASTLDVHEKAMRNAYVDAIEELKKCGFEFKGGII